MLGHLFIPTQSRVRSTYYGAAWAIVPITGTFAFCIHSHNGMVHSISILSAMFMLVAINGLFSCESTA